MPRLVAPNRRLGLAGRRLVTDAGGAPCCCDPGCFDEFPTSQCITLTLEVVDSTPACAGPGFGVSYSEPPPEGSFQLENTAFQPNTYTANFDISVDAFRCGTGELWDRLDALEMGAGLECSPDAWDGATRYGLPILNAFSGPEARWLTTLLFGFDTTIDWFGTCPDLNALPPWTHEQRPGSTVLMEGETALTPWPPELPCNQPTVRYRVSWARTVCVDVPQTGACCHPDGSCTDVTADDCQLAGGTYKGDGTECAGRNCPTDADEGACCLPTGLCTFGTRDECAAAGGKFTFGVGCAKVACIPYEPREGEGACCLPSGFCLHATAAECSLRGGTIIGTRCESLYCSGDPPQQVTAGDFF